MVQAIGIRGIPSSSALYADFWDGTPAIRGLVPRYFGDPSSFTEQAELVRARRLDRATLCSLLREQNGRFGAGPDVMESIRMLEEPSSTVVIGGQQAGLFGGPLYTLHKAATILSLARRARQLVGSPVVPVFWIASEDSDLAEIDHCHVTDRQGLLRELRLPRASTAKIPVSRVRLGDGVGVLLEELAALLPQDGFSEEVLADLRSAYSPGRTYPQAFGAWMTRLFKGRGLVLVDPSDDGLKRLAQPLFEREIVEASPVSSAAIEQTARVKNAGYAAQIELREGYLTLFHQDPERDAIVITDGGFQLKSSGRRFSREKLASLLRGSPGSFTPNAVLRPLFQDAIFPTLAVVLGPAELAYFCQLTSAYQRMGIPMPVMVPRASLTIVEPAVERLRVKLGVDLGQLLGRGERIIDDIVKRRIPETLAARLGDGRRSVANAWRAIVAEIDALDPTLRRTAVLGSARSLGQIDFMERKIAQAARRKETVLRSQVGRLVAALAPRGGLQERTLAAPTFLARGGPRLIDMVMEGIDCFAAEHRVLVEEP